MPPFSFRRSSEAGHALRGSCCAPARGRIDADAALDRQQQEIERRGLEGPAREQALRGVGASVACGVLPLVHRMSALGAVSADCKPSNIVFTEADAARAIDFDANMFALLTPAACEWPVCMLHNAALLSAHVRAFRPAPLADGWSGRRTPLAFDLCRYEREQLAAARARVQTEAELPGEGTDARDAPPPHGQRLLSARHGREVRAAQGHGRAAH